MKHARADYNEIETNGTLRRIPKDEPVFLLRAQDMFAADTVRFWALQVSARGGDPAIVNMAHAHANEMERWPVKKMPDLPAEPIEEGGIVAGERADGARPMGAPTAQSIHPSPDEFTEAELAVDPILRFFHYKHLPPALLKISAPFCLQARGMIDGLPRNAERTVALRKLLEAKDCAVRAALP